MLDVGYSGPSGRCCVNVITQECSNYYFLIPFAWGVILFARERVRWSPSKMLMVT